MVNYRIMTQQSVDTSETKTCKQGRAREGTMSKVERRLGAVLKETARLTAMLECLGKDHPASCKLASNMIWRFLFRPLAYLLATTLLSMLKCT